MTAEGLVVDVSRDWAIACQVQQGFMQGGDGALGSLDFGARCRQVRELGGDCYDFVPLPGDRLAMAVGDASGKGLAAALMISNVQAALRTAMLFTGGNGPKVIRAVNRQVYASSLADPYATLFYGVFDEATRTLQYVNAGHSPPMVIRRDGSMTYLETGGAPVGMFPDWSYEEGMIRLAEGDRVVAYTDGVVEVANPAGEEWGVEALYRATAERPFRSAQETVEAIFTAMDEFSHGQQNDDATVAVLQLR